MILLFVELCVSAFCSNSRYVVDSSVFMVEGCLFSSLSTTLSGSVVYGKDVSGSLNVVNCMFYCCTSVISGGAIYYDCTGSGSSCFNKVCGRMCFFSGDYISGSERGHFGYILTSQSKNNSIFYLSIVECAPEMKNGVGSICLRYGKQIVKDSNSSNNKCYYSGSFESIHGNSTIFSRCTYVNNHITRFHNLYFNGGFNECMIESLNVIGNNGPDCGVLSIQHICQYNVNNSIFINNSQYLFGSYGGYGGNCILTVMKCFISHTGVVSNPINGGVVNLNQIEYKEVSTFSLVHFSTYYCPADNQLLVPTSNSIISKMFLSIFQIGIIHCVLCY